MPDSPTKIGPVTSDELQVLLRIAGLAVAGDRLPQVLAELNAQLAHAAAFAQVLAGADTSAGGGASSPAAPYDPTFPAVRLEVEEA